jgi:NTP pyrophosphatase (non-canonical NTP hydrolase)
MNNMEQLIENVEQWSIDKGLHEGNSFTQYAKSSEEMGEIASALCRNNTDALRDGIGDVVVTLIILAQQNNMTLYECLNTAYEEIKDRKGRTINNTFIKESDLND